MRCSLLRIWHDQLLVYRGFENVSAEMARRQEVFGECRKYPGTTIVTDSVTSNGLSQYISKLGGRHYRYRRGYKNVINKGIELAKEGVDCQLMMETRCVVSLVGLRRCCMLTEGHGGSPLAVQHICAGWWSCCSAA